MNEQVKEEVAEIFRSDMKTAEKMDNLIDDREPHEINEAAVEVMEELLGKIEDKNREKFVYATCFQIAQSTGNEELKNYAGQKLQEWVQQNG